jgi:SAM-dependent methyltransferase
MPDTVALQTSEWTGPVGSAWAEQWRRTDRSFGPLTDCLLEPGAIGRFAHALDIGCGAGELVQRLAASHPSAQILGIDISAELLDVARARCAQLGNARVEETDAATWHAQADAQPDLLISRHGVMFFADPVAAFSHLRQQSAPGAQLRFSCFRARSENEWVTALMGPLPSVIALASNRSLPPRGGTKSNSRRWITGWWWARAKTRSTGGWPTSSASGRPHGPWRNCPNAKVRQRSNASAPCLLDTRRTVSSACPLPPGS